MFFLLFLNLLMETGIKVKGKKINVFKWFKVQNSKDYISYRQSKKSD